jgi:hypothetical protein
MFRPRIFLFFTLLPISFAVAEDRELISAIGTYQKAVVDVGTLEVISAPPVLPLVQKLSNKALTIFTVVELLELSTPSFLMGV